VKKADKLKAPSLGLKGKPFLDSRSRVTRDGRTILYGDDMVALRRRVYFRCNGFCESLSHASKCYDPHWVSWENGHLHHKRTRGLGGCHRNDTEENCAWLSQPCHKEWHEAERRQIW